MAWPSAWLRTTGGATNTLQFGGVALRCVGTSDTVMVKVQNNSSATNPTSFDSIWLYEQPGSAATKTGITPTFPRALVRLALLGQRAEAFVDSDLDGKWDHVVSKTLTVTPKVGPVAIDGFGGVQIDDFEIFDAVILADTANPRPHARIRPQVRAPRQVRRWIPRPPLPLSNTGIVLPDGRIIPLTPDTIFTISVTGVLPTVFSNYANWLDINGDGFGQAGRAACHVPGRNHLVYRVHHVRRQRHSPGQQRPPGNHRAVADPSVGGTIPLRPPAARREVRSTMCRGPWGWNRVVRLGSGTAARCVSRGASRNQKPHHDKTHREIPVPGIVFAPQTRFARENPVTHNRRFYLCDANRVIHDRRFHTKRHRFTRTGACTSESNLDPWPAQRHFPPSCTPPPPVPGAHHGASRFPG